MKRLLRLLSKLFPLNVKDELIYSQPCLVDDEVEIAYSGKTDKRIETFLEISSCAEYGRWVDRNQEKFRKYYGIRGAMDTDQASLYFTLVLGLALPSTRSIAKVNPSFPTNTSLKSRKGKMKP